MLKWPIATPFFSVCFKAFPKRSIKSSFALVLCLLDQFVLIHRLINQTYRPRNSSCLLLFPFQLAASICVDSNTPLQQEIFQSTQVPGVRISREAFSSLPEPPSHLREIRTSQSGLSSLRYFRQEPGSPFGFVDPNLDQTGGRDIVVVVANLVGGPQTSRQLLVVIAQLADHLERSDRFVIIIFQPLVFPDVADRTDRCPANLARALCDIVGHREDLRRLLVEQQVIIAKMAAAHMPVKILRLHVKREDVRKQLTQVACNFLHPVSAEIRSCRSFIFISHCLCSPFSCRVNIFDSANYSSPIVIC